MDEPKRREANIREKAAGLGAYGSYNEEPTSDTGGGPKKTRELGAGGPAVATGANKIAETGAARARLTTTSKSKLSPEQQRKLSSPVRGSGFGPSGIFK